MATAESAHGCEESAVDKEFHPMCELQLSRGPPTVQLQIRELNSLLTCGLCKGYLVNATTITECLHSFCKSCIVPHVEHVSVCCPTCGNIIHPSNPYTNMRLDSTIQDIVYKILPRMELDEKLREKEFYESRGLPYPPPRPQQPADASKMKKKKVHLSPDELAIEDAVSVQLRHAGSAKGIGALRNLEKSFLRVSSQATIGHVQRFLDRKLNTSQLGQINLFVDTYLLHQSLTLQDIRELFFHEDLEEELLVLQYGLMPHKDYFYEDSRNLNNIRTVSDSPNTTFDSIPNEVIVS